MVKSMVKVFIRSDEDVLDALMENVTRFRLAVQEARQRPAEIEAAIDGLLDEFSRLRELGLEVVSIEDKELNDRLKWGCQSKIAELIAVMNDPTTIDAAELDLAAAEDRLAAYVAREWISPK